MTKRVENFPLNVPMTAPSGKVAPEWLRWFQLVQYRLDEVRQENRKIYTDTDATLTTRDLGMVILMNIGTGNYTCTLPSVETSDLYSWVKIVRIGTGKLSIRAADSDTIETSSTGGKIWCNENPRKGANVLLQLVQDTEWAIIAGTGIWAVS